MSQNVTRRRLLIGLVIALVGLVYGLFDFIYITQAYPGEKVNYAELINHALVVTVLLLCFEYLYEALHSIETFASGKTLGEIVQILDKLDSGKSRAIGAYVQRDSGIIGKLLDMAHSELDTTLSLCANGEGFVISHDVLALYSYEDFWNLLVSEQQRRQHDKESPLHVEITHSCEMGIWRSHDLTPRLIGYQKTFSDAGGKVARILCANDAEPSSAIVNAARSMRQAGIHVFYCNVTKAPLDYRFTWDFLHVRETGVSVIWESFGRGPGGVIERSVYQRSGSYGGKNLEVLWRDIKQHSTELKDET